MTACIYQQQTLLPRRTKATTMVIIALLSLLLTTTTASSLEAISTTKPISLAPNHRHLDLPKRGKFNAFSPLTDLTTNADSLSIARGGSADIQSDLNKQIGGVVVFTLIDIFLRKLFKVKGIKFPSTLAGSCLVFAIMVVLDAIKGGWGKALFDMLNPGAGLLAKWMSVFFLPALATMPLAPKIGSTLEMVKVLSVVILGFMFTLATTAFTSLAIRNAQGVLVETAGDESGETSTVPATKKPYSEDILSFLIKAFVISGAVSIGATVTNNAYATPLQTIFFFLGTVGSFVWGARLPSEITKVVHPLVTGTAFTLVLAQLMASITGTSFTDVLRTYKAGTLEPMKTGAGDILLFLLGPAVVSLSTAMYSRKQLLADNFLVVMTSELVTTFGGLYSTAAFVRLLKLGGDGGNVLRMSCLPRMITTALAMAASDMLEGNTSITASIVVLTGIIGATFGTRILTAWGVNDPVSRGLGIGAAAQGLGVASITHEKDAFPFAAIMMVFTAFSVTTVVSIPFVAESLRKIATGA